MTMGKDNFLMCMKGKEPRNDICFVLILFLTLWPEYVWRGMLSPLGYLSGPLVDTEPQSIQCGPGEKHGTKKNEKWSKSLSLMSLINCFITSKLDI